MAKTICDTMETMLASVQEEIDDPDLAFKLRTARQLSIACKDQVTTYQQTLEEVELDEETAERLQDLGYL